MTFTIPAIKGKGRPRFTKVGGVYTPEETREYEDLVKLCYQQAGGTMHNGPVEVIINAVFGRPKAHYRSDGKTLKQKAPHWHTGRPDVDNIAKAICDSLNKLAWHDDSSISRLLVSKYYGPEEGCRVLITDGRPGPLTAYWQRHEAN